MSLSLIGLIIIQWYWIENAIEAESARFENSINESLANTTRSLQKDEAAGYLFKVINEGGKNFYSVDTIRPDSENYISESDDNHRNMIDSIPRVKTFLMDSTTAPTKKVTEVEFDNYLNKSIMPADSNLNATQRRKMIRTIITEKNKIVSEVVNELVYYNANLKIEDRLSNDKLLRALDMEFKNKGYDFEFHFNVETGDTLLFKCDETTSAALRSSKYKTKLFPGEFSSNHNYLLLYIPEEGGIILQSVWVIIALSVFFIVVIIIIFYRTLLMFIKQKKVSEMKDDLISNITHEFKTPISTISLAVENLKEPGLIRNKSVLKRYSDIIKEETNRLLEMVDTLLSTASIEKGEYLLNKSDCNLHNIIESVIARFDLLIKQSNVNIVTQFNSAKPIIEADEFHFSNLLINIIDNSIKYNQHSPKIIIATSDKDRLISLTISDNGIGIDKKQLRKIFDTFYRAPTGNVHNVKGYGIGLSYVKKMVEVHGGTINVKSKLNEGTIFEILIPVKL